MFIVKHCMGSGGACYSNVNVMSFLSFCSLVLFFSSILFLRKIELLLPLRTSNESERNSITTFALWSGMLPRRCRCRQRRERQAVMGGCATGQCAVGGARLGALPRSSGPEDRALACSCVRSTGADAELQRMRVGEGWCARRARWHRY